MSDEITGAKNTWPHKFVKNGPEELIHPKGSDGKEHIENFIKVVPMICVTCNIEYTLGKDSIPPGPCPARSDKDELRRLHNGA